MSPLSKRARIIVLILVLAYLSFTLFLVVSSAHFRSEIEPLPAKDLSILELVLIPSAAFCVVFAWLISGRGFWATRLRRGHLGRPAILLFFCYVLLLSPSLMGRLLFYLGMSVTALYVLYAATAVGVFAWALYDLRTN